MEASGLGNCTLSFTVVWGLQHQFGLYTFDLRSLVLAYKGDSRILIKTYLITADSLQAFTISKERRLMVQLVKWDPEWSKSSFLNPKISPSKLFFAAFPNHSCGLWPPLSLLRLNKRWALHHPSTVCLHGDI